MQQEHVVMKVLNLFLLDLCVTQQNVFLRLSMQSVAIQLTRALLSQNVSVRQSLDICMIKLTFVSTAPRGFGKSKKEVQVAWNAFPGAMAPRKHRQTSL